MSRLHVGRVRKKMAAMLRVHGLIIAPEHIDTQEGPLCLNTGNDLARWFGLCQWTEEKTAEHGWLNCYVFSWDRMSDCVRFGFTVRLLTNDIGRPDAEITAVKTLEDYRREQKATNGLSA